MLRASEAIVLDENFGPQSRDILASMPALQSTNMYVLIFVFFRCKLRCNENVYILLMKPRWLPCFRFATHVTILQFLCDHNCYCHFVVFHVRI